MDKEDKYSLTAEERQKMMNALGRIAKERQQADYASWYTFFDFLADLITALF